MSILEIRNCCVAYELREVLHHFSLNVGERDFIVLRGKNGGGKTTLIKLMVGLLQPVHGEVWRREGLSVGYLPQYRSIDRQFPLTVLQTVRSGLQSGLPLWRGYSKEHDAAALRQLEQLGLAALANRPISALSGGQWQVTLLARALVSQPQLLLLDEPDTHLDHTAREALYTTLLAEHERRAVVVVSHDKGMPLPPDARVVEIE